MARKRETSSLLSPEDHEQVENLLSHYHQLAERLHNTTTQAEAEAALSDINTLSEAAQIALLKALSKENERDAADIAAALNAFSPHKEVRKEARRSLIRLEGIKVYPQWTPPITYTPAIQVSIPNPPRFWKGVVRQMREEGELHLYLCWEQGYDYSEVRALSFLLDYWQEGLKDFYVETGTRRYIDEHISTMSTRMPDVPYVDCTLAEGKRLIEEALSVNEWRATPPHQDYRNYLPTINKLIFQATDLGEDRGRTFIDPDLTEEEVAINFLGAWSMGDYGLTYDLLSSDNSLRADKSRDEWIEEHRRWANEAHPARMELSFVREIEHTQSALWVPSSIGARSSSRKQTEIGWSLELLDSPLSGTIKEMQMGTTVNKETGRHWFWTSYTLIREQNAWRIQKITDEGLNIQGLSITDLQARIKEQEEALDKLVQERNKVDAQEFLRETSWRLSYLLHYEDALITRLPLDYNIVQQTYEHAVLTGNPERIAVYLDRMAQRFPNNRADTLRHLGATLVELAYKYDPQIMRDRYDHLLARAEEALRDAIAAQDNAMGHILLGELLLSQLRNDEAEKELLKAREKSSDRNEEASIEAGLGNLAMRTERLEEAIPHYKRVAEINPQYPAVWFSLGFAYRLLGRFDEAEASLQQGIQIDPSDIRSYNELTAIYMNRGESERARALLDQALHLNPESPELHALQASVLFEMGDRRGAQRQLDEAEKLAPDLELVQAVRQAMNTPRKR